MYKIAGMTPINFIFLCTCLNHVKQFDISGLCLGGRKGRVCDLHLSRSTNFSWLDLVARRATYLLRYIRFFFRILSIICAENCKFSSKLKFRLLLRRMILNVDFNDEYFTWIYKIQAINVLKIDVLYFRKYHVVHFNVL